MIDLNNVVEQPEVRTSFLVTIKLEHCKQLVEIGIIIFKNMVKLLDLDLKIGIS